MYDALVREIRRAAAEAPRMYFAPLVGAIRGIASEYRRLDREHWRKHAAADRPDRDLKNPDLT
jgi:hypothetical protein